MEIKSLTKALNVLETLVDRGEMQVAELSEALAMPKTSIHRMLTALESRGYVRQDQRSLGYSASLKLFELGRKIVQKLEFVELASPLLVELAGKTGETVNLGILDGIEVICIHKVESPHHLRIEQPLGSREKAYRAAMGKTILAFLPTPQTQRLLREHPIVVSTAKSLESVAAIEHELEHIRNCGYAVDDEEGTLGVRCVGAPVFQGDSRVVAGISVAGPTVRMNEAQLHDYAVLVQDTARELSRQLATIS